VWGSVGAIGFGAAAIGCLFLPRGYWIALFFGLFAALSLSNLRKRTGELVLEADHVAVTNGSRSLRVPLGEIVDTGVFDSRAVLSEPRVQWVARTTQRPHLLVARLEPREADEVSLRIAVRQRALRLGGASLAPALEVLHLASAEALGVTETAEGWRPFYSARELVDHAASPYREQGRVRACVRADVWAAAQALDSELASRIEVVALT
jgi:hypothetical protein